MLTNALLVRYEGGYRQVAAPASIAQYGRREGFVSLGQVDSTAEVDRLGDAILDVRDAPAWSTVAKIDPTGAGDVPYVDFEQGDRITAPDETGAAVLMRVVGITVTEDQLGRAIYTPELRSPHDELEHRLDRTMRRLSAGSLGGTVENASPPTGPGPIGELQTALPPKILGFGQPGAVALAEEEFELPWSGLLSTIVARVRVAGTTATILELYVNGVSAGTVTIPATQNRGTTTFNVDVSEGDLLLLEVTQAGTGAQGLNGWARVAVAA